MIFVIGEYVISLIEDTKGKYVSHIGGSGYNTASECVAQEAYAGFLSPISKDANGQKVLNTLVEKDILFDPDLCNSPYPSTLMLSTKDETGSVKYDYYLDNTASTTLTKEILKNTLELHSDVEVVHIGSLSMLIDPTSSAIKEVLTDFNPKPIIFVDPNINRDEIVNIANWKNKLYDFFKIANIIKLSDKDLDFIFPKTNEKQSIEMLKEINPLSHIILTRGEKNATWFTPEGREFNQEKYNVITADTISSSDKFSASLLAYLSKEKVFGSEVEDPQLQLNEEIIRKALKYACYGGSFNKA